MEEKDLRPKWLTELQQKSWEPEVLLSGIVLYGMFKMPELLDDLLYYFRVNFADNSNNPENFVSLMKVAVYWLTGGLIAHLISRGIWVGMVGLSFTFPKGINREKLKLTDKYISYLARIPSTEKIILNLESFSSTLFSISFLMFMMMIGAYFYLLVTVITPVFIIFYGLDPSFFQNDTFSTILGIYVLIVIGIAFLGFIDFVTLGFFKRFKWVAKIYWPFYRFLGALTLARFYRPIYYILISNVRGWKIALMLVSFVVLSIQWVSKISSTTYPGENYSQISLWEDTQGFGAYTGYYDDQIDDIKSIEASIQSDIVRGNTIRLFIVMRAQREDSIKAYCNLDSLLKIDGILRADANLQCLSKFYSITIDDSTFTDLSMKFHYKSKTKQKGLLTYLDIRYLDIGLHHLKIQMPDSMYRNNTIANIPFYREEPYPGYLIPKGEANENENDSYLKLKPILPK